MNVVNNIGTEVRGCGACWKCHCEFSLICSSIFNTEKRKLTAILIEGASFQELSLVYGNLRNPFLDLMNIIVRLAISLNR